MGDSPPYTGHFKNNCIYVDQNSLPLMLPVIVSYLAVEF